VIQRGSLRTIDSSFRPLKLCVTDLPTVNFPDGIGVVMFSSDPKALSREESREFFETAKSTPKTKTQAPVFRSELCSLDREQSDARHERIP
jgi:hypothetical protein